jgi:hypothetical protein
MMDTLLVTSLVTPFELLEVSRTTSAPAFVVENTFPRRRIQLDKSTTEAESIENANEDFEKNVLC